MLTQIIVKNLAIVSELELNFGHGMHVITGETGAGKSIIIDALSIVLGERASPDQIRVPATQAEVTASFCIKNLPAVQYLLAEQGLETEQQECIIRRIINSDGRSRAYINGHSVTAQQLKTLAPHLVHIHSQHQHHALLASDYQRQIVDVYANHQQLLTTVHTIYQDWSHIKQQIQNLTDIQQQADKLNLLNYQIQELDSLNLLPNELQELDQKHKQLAKSEELLNVCQTVEQMLSGSSEHSSNTDGNISIQNQLHSAIALLNNMQKLSPKLAQTAEMLRQANIQVEEAAAELNDFYTRLDLDPNQLVTIEQRLSAIHTLARKLKVAPEFLHEHYVKLGEERDSLAKSTELLEQLQKDLIDCELKYKTAAEKLTTSRLQASQKLSTDIMQRLSSLEMPNAKFDIKFEPLKHQNPSPHGNETIHFMVTTNPGQPLGLLNKIASGGELSRISLAIQVINAQLMATPTLIMDEVDVGISGKTALTVGHLMRQLGANAQILCITHLPQVASQAHMHFKVEKIQTTSDTITQITPLNDAQRLQELARLMGGRDITPEAIAHAKQLLESVEEDIAHA